MQDRPKGPATTVPPPGSAKAARRARDPKLAYEAAKRASGGTTLARLAAMLASGTTSRELHALVAVLRSELTGEQRASFVKQLEVARKHHWLVEHRLAIALQVFDAGSDEAALAILHADGIPDDVKDTVTELRAARRELAAEGRPGDAGDD